jgi:CelD/BcsL family acetyltransferase involved in cellulose biosynthesis
MTSAPSITASARAYAGVAGQALDVVRIEDDAQFAALAERWNAAARASLSNHVFLSHEWATAAWAWRRRESSLALLVARDATGIVAILPLLRAKNSPRRLDLLTVPDTQFADLIVASDRAAEAAEALAAALERTSDWDVMRLDYLQPDGAIARHLVPALVRHGMQVEVAQRGTNPYIALDKPRDAYFANRSRRLKKALNLAANRLRRAGTVTIERIDASADDPAFERGIDTAIAISAASWKATTGTSLDNAGPQAFIRRLSSAARQRGWLSLWLLHLDGRALAMEYQLTDQGRVYALRADHLAGHDEISPGSHLFRELLEALFDGTHIRYYLGPGDNPYKARWSEQGEPMIRATVYHRTFRGRLAWLWACRIKPPLRRVRDRLQRRDADPAAARVHVDDP